MFTPAYKLTMGGKTVDTTDDARASTVVELSVSVSINGPADRFVLLLGNVGGIQPRPDAETSLELGYDDDGGTSQVVTGLVRAVEPGLATTRVVGYGGAMKAMRAFADQTYERKSAGEIVRDLAAKADLQVETAEDGINFPVYVVDGRRSVHAHMLELAALCGFDLYFNPAGSLVFEQFANTRTAHVFEYGKHVVALDVRRTPPAAGAVEVWGEGATGSDGNAAAPWLTTDFGGSKGTAGSGRPRLLERPALRTQSGARIAADAALTDIRRRTLRGRLLATGRPAVKLGDAVRLRGLSDDALNADYQVRAVTHHITKAGGFTTTVDFRSLET